jgi:hypothetical protein
VAICGGKKAAHTPSDNELKRLVNSRDGAHAAGLLSRGEIFNRFKNRCRLVL